jgi:uncharacterized protein involved in response to NO
MEQPNDTSIRPVSWPDFGREPFRILFPLAVLAGILGVALWPLHFAEIIASYPGQTHARLMAFGFFGGFIFGFLGTAMPRMLSASPLGLRNVLLLAGCHIAMALCFFIQRIEWGDRLFLILFVFFLVLMIRRASRRKDTPPPGFMLVGMALLCGLAGAVLAVVHPFQPEMDTYWVMLQRLLSYQGFVLLPILGVGPFILPRFFGLESPHDFPEMRLPTRAWLRKAALAFAVGLVIILSFFVEVSGWPRTAYAVRFLFSAAYLLLEFPLHRAPGVRNALGASLRIAFLTLVLGFAAIVFFPAQRVGLLHLTLVGGFGVITFVVATRVVFGHSGNIARLRKSNRWLLAAVLLMLLGMATRVSGDLWPQVMASHYTYGALIWIAAVLFWAAYVLPRVRQIEVD